MAIHLWSIFCNSTSVDQNTNNVSLFGVTEQIEITGAPVDGQILLPAQFQLVITWMRSNLDEPETGVTKFSLQLPNGEIMPGAELPCDLTTAIRNRTVITINGLPLKGPGIYHFVIETKKVDDKEWTKVNELPLQITFK